MYFNSLNVLIIIVDLVHCNTDVHGKLFGRGICPVRRTDTKEVTVTQVIVKGEESWELCWNWPPWCKVIQRYITEKIKTEVDIPHDHLILNCCSGFKNNDDATACLPVCSSFCKSDSCIDKDVCIKCQTGYSEPFCLKDNKLVNESNELNNLQNLSLCQCPNDNCTCTSDYICSCAIESEGLSEDNGKTCLQQTVQVALYICVLLLSLIILIFVIKKHFYYNAPNFEQISDTQINA